MGKILILNGSPRAPKSNSKRYAEIFMRHCTAETDYRNITKKNHEELCAALSGYTDVLFAFPLYADSLPVGFLNFLKALEACPPVHKPVVSILINCGFLEAEQSEVAIRMMRLFCRRNGYVMGSVLMLGSGEAILDTPFKYVATRNIRRLAQSMVSGRYHNLLDILWQAVWYYKEADADDGGRGKVAGSCRHVIRLSVHVLRIFSMGFPLASSSTSLSR